MPKTNQIARKASRTNLDSKIEDLTHTRNDFFPKIRQKVDKAQDQKQNFGKGVDFGAIQD